MDRVGVRAFGCRDDPRRLQVAFRGHGRPDANGLIGQLQVRGIAIRFRINDGDLDSEIAARPDHAEGNLAAVRDQNTVKHKEKFQVPGCRV